MPLIAFIIAVLNSIVLFQCHVAQCLASWGHGPLPHHINLPLSPAERPSRCQPTTEYYVLKAMTTLTG